MRLIVDQFEKTTVSATGYTSANTHRFQARDGFYYKLIAIAGAFDAAFLTNGRYSMKVAGSLTISSNSPTTEYQPLKTTFDYELGPNSRVYVLPGQTVEIAYRVTAASGEVQSAFVLLEMSRAEYEADKRGVSLG